MGSGNSGGVVGFGIEGAWETNPLEPAPGGCSEGERAVENSVHVGTVPPTLRSAVSADDRIVAGDEDGASVARVRTMVRGVKRKRWMAMAAPRASASSLLEDPGRATKRLARMVRCPLSSTGAQRMAAAPETLVPPASDVAPSYAISRPRSRGQPVTGFSSDASTWTGVPAGIVAVLTSRQRKRSQVWQ